MKKEKIIKLEIIHPTDTLVLIFAIHGLWNIWIIAGMKGVLLGLLIFLSGWYGLQFYFKGFIYLLENWRNWLDKTKELLKRF